MLFRDIIICRDIIIRSCPLLLRRGNSSIALAIEHLLSVREVAGSIPGGPKKEKFYFSISRGLAWSQYKYGVICQVLNMSPRVNNILNFFTLTFLHKKATGTKCHNLAANS